MTRFDSKYALPHPSLDIILISPLYSTPFLKRQGISSLYHGVRRHAHIQYPGQMRYYRHGNQCENVRFGINESKGCLGLKDGEVSFL
jgi:hypothetical protein